MIASRLGLDDNGIGGGTFGEGVDLDVTADGREEGTGGGEGALLLKPISNADRWGGRCGGGGATALFTRGASLDACLCGMTGAG